MSVNQTRVSLINNSEGNKKYKVLIERNGEPASAGIVFARDKRAALTKISMRLFDEGFTKLTIKEVEWTQCCQVSNWIS